MGILARARQWLGGNGITVRSVPLLQSARDDFDPGGALSGPMPMPVRTQWLLNHIQQAQRMADGGNMLMVSQLSEAMRLDGLYAGLLSTRTNGLVILKKEFAGRGPRGIRYDVRHPLVDLLKDDFDVLCPPGELAAFQADFDIIGVAVGELVERRHGLTFVRHRADRLQWDWSSREWRFNGEVITPGDGRWVLHSQVEVSPWNRGAWYACARAFIAKDHAYHLRENYSHKLANAARVAEVPENATQMDAQRWFQQVAGWSVDPVFAMRPGYKVDLLESTGQGYQVYAETMKQADNDLMVALAGQTVTVTGGTGFQNSNIHEAIRADIIQFGATSLARVINTQVIPWWQQTRAWDEETRVMDVRVSYDTINPSERKQRAETAQVTCTALTTAASGGFIGRIDVDSVLSDAGVPLLPTASAASPLLLPRAA